MSKKTFVCIGGGDVAAYQFLLERSIRTKDTYHLVEMEPTFLKANLITLRGNARRRINDTPQSALTETQEQEQGRKRICKRRLDQAVPVNELNSKMI
jgi:hypothetical protein